jgi:uncharacterized protein
MKIDVSRVSRDGQPLDVEVCGEDVGELCPGITVVDAVRFKGSVARMGHDLMLRGTAEGMLRATCSRCLAKFTQGFEVPVAARYVLEAAPGDSTEEDENVGESQLSYDGIEIDLVPPVRNELILEAPVKPLCSLECRGLCPGCGVDLNEELCKCEEQTVDPRLAPLKDVLGRL